MGLERSLAWWRTNRAFLIILLTAFAVRVVWLVHAEPTPVSDFQAYRQLAADLLDHRQLGYPERTTFYLPMHPLHLALWSAVSRSTMWLGFSSVVLSTASVGLIYAVGLRLHTRRRVALTASALFALLPVFVLFSPVLATEHLFIVFMLSAMLCLVNLSDRSWVLAGLTGALVGCAMLTRGEGVFYVPALVLFLWMGSSATSWRNKAKLTTLLGIGIAVILCPWYVRNSVIASPDAGLSTGAGINFYFAHNDSGIYGWHQQGSPLDGLNNEEANRLGWKLGLTHMRENPLSIVADIGFGTSELFRAPDYAWYWSTRSVKSGGNPLNPDSFVDTRIRFDWAYVFVLAIPVLLVLSVAAILAYRSWSRQIVWLIVPLILSSWILRTVIYWAKPRYGYFIQVMLVYTAALALVAITNANRAPTQSESAVS